MVRARPDAGVPATGWHGWVGADRGCQTVRAMNPADPATPSEAPTRARTNPQGASLWWGLLAVVLLALNLRPGATSLGPVLAEVSASLGIDPAVAGALTGVPGFAFAVFGLLAVAISLRVGLTGALAVGAVASAVGLLGRPLVDGVPAFFALTLLAFAGMALGNVLVPAYVKAHYPHRVAFMMSAYTIALSVGATGASLISAPLSQVGPGGWRSALGLWGVTAAVAAVPWVVMAVIDRRRRRAAPPAEGVRPSGSVFGVIRSRKAVALAVFFGMQSMQAYTQFGWLAQIYRDGGLTPAEAGVMASVVAGFGIPAGFVMPAIAVRMRDPRPVVLALGLLLGGGYLGVWLAPTALPAVWATMLGVSGFAFPFAMALITARTRDPHITGQLSGFAQSVGYVFAAAGPLLVGVLFAATGGWTVPLWFLLGSAVVFTGAGLIASAPGYIDDELGRG